MKKIISIVCLTVVSLAAQAQIQTNAGVQYLQCMPKDVSTDFSDLSNTYFLADSLDGFPRTRIIFDGFFMEEAGVSVPGMERKSFCKTLLFITINAGKTCVKKYQAAMQ